MLYGNGLRSGFANTDEAPAYYTFNIGLTHTINLPQLGKLQLRFDVVNLFDKGIRYAPARELACLHLSLARDAVFLAAFPGCFNPLDSFRILALVC
jgi:hypothetical protein